MSTLSQQIFAPDGAEVYSNLFMPRARETCCFCFPLREGLLICAILLVMLDTAALYGAFIRLWEPSTDWHLPFVNASAPGCAACVISSPTLEEGHNHTAPPPPPPARAPFTRLSSARRLADSSFDFNWVDVVQSAWELVFVLMITVAVGWGTAQRERSYNLLRCGLCGFATAILLDVAQVCGLRHSAPTSSPLSSTPCAWTGMTAEERRSTRPRARPPFCRQAIWLCLLVGLVASTQHLSAGETWLLIFMCGPPRRT